MRFRTITYGHLLAIVLLCWLTFVVLTTKELRFLDGVNLIFHEAGHFILFWMPTFVMILGGTLGQLAVPIICAVAFWRERKFVSTMCMVWWVGQNLVNISVYAADARARVLPLLGGSAVEHDWANMLATLGLLEYDTVIANALFFTGACVMAFAVLQIGLHTHATLQRRYIR